MSLRAGTPLWKSDDPPRLEAPALAGDMACEVAVLGGGITGALVAAQMAQEGIDVVVVDKRSLGEGSTAACTGLLQHEIDLPLVDLIATVGEAGAVHAYRRGLAAIDEIEALCRALDAPCGFSRRNTVYFASHWWHRRKLVREFECRRHFGFEVALLEPASGARRASLGGKLAIRAPGDAQIDPFRFSLALLRQAQRHGARLLAETEITQIDSQSDAVVLQAETGRISARRIVFAVGYDSERYLPRRLGTLHSTYAVASEPIAHFSGWPDGALIWETARPYFYARQTDDGRAVIGGADTSFSTDHWRPDLIAGKAHKLEKRFRRLFPQIEFTPDCAWAGVFGESPDGLPYIGQVPERPLAYFAIGYGGNGITFSAIAARLITDLYLGRPNDDAEVFRFGR